MGFFGLILSKTDLWLLGIAGSLAITWIVFRLNDTLSQKNRFRTGADKFRNIVMAEFKGIIPVNGFWKPEVYEIIRNSIPTIKQAALEFRPTIPYIRKSRFDKAVMEYCNQSENINWEQAILDAADEVDPEESQKGKFVKCVFHLLSFTE